MKQLGDKHNNGKFVYQQGEWIYKPRTIFWEYFFLYRNSPFWNVLESDFPELLNYIPVKYLANLNFEDCSIEGDFSKGRVEFLNIDPIPKQFYFELQNCEDLGMLLGFFSVLGFGDLCSSNFKFGIDKLSKKILATPIDIECVFNDYLLPSQTSLLPSSYVDERQCGFYPLTEVFDPERQSGTKALAAFLYGYAKFITVFEQFELKFNESISNIKLLGSVPIRVLIRSTKEYLSNKKYFEKSEIEQLNIGDIPYFFTFLSKDTIYCLDEQGNRIKAILSLRSKNESLKFYRGFDKNNILQNRNRKTALFAGGVLQIAKMFLKDKVGIFSYKEFYLTCDKGKFDFSIGDKKFEN